MDEEEEEEDEEEEDDEDEDEPPINLSLCFTSNLCPISISNNLLQ